MRPPVLVLALLAAAGAAAGAAEPPKPSGDIVLPAPSGPLAPTPEMEKLAFLLGTWKVSSKPDPKNAAAGVSGTDAITYGPGGYSFIGNFRGTGPSGTLRGHSILAWDPGGRRYLSVWTDNLTPGATLSWGHWEGQDLVFEESPAKGETGTIRTVYFAIKPDRYEWRMERRLPDGRTERLAAMTYERSSGP